MDDKSQYVLSVITIRYVIVKCYVHTTRHATTRRPRDHRAAASWRARDLASGDAKLPSNTKLGHIERLGKYIHSTIRYQLHRTTSWLTTVCIICLCHINTRPMPPDYL